MFFCMPAHTVPAQKGRQAVTVAAWQAAADRLPNSWQAGSGMLAPQRPSLTASSSLTTSLLYSLYFPVLLHVKMKKILTHLLRELFSHSDFAFLCLLPPFSLYFHNHYETRQDFLFCIAVKNGDHATAISLHLPIKLLPPLCLLFPFLPLPFPFPSHLSL